MSHPLYDLLRRLEEDHVYFTISRHRDDSIMITATYVGERLEIDVFEDGHMEVSRFKGSEDILGDSDLAYRILDEYKAEEEKWDKELRNTEPSRPANPTPPGTSAAEQPRLPGSGGG
jgi:hypothetical protein